MADVVITEFMDEAVVSSLTGEFEVLYDPTLPERADDLTKAVQGARALIVRNRTQVDHQLLSNASRLELVGRLGTGLDNIDVESCNELGIEIASGIGLNTIGVAEYVLATALWLRRGFNGAHDGVIAGDWPRRAHIGRELSGDLLGLIGFGAIARAVAERAHAFGLRSVAYDPYIPDDAIDVWRTTSPASLEEVLTSGDVVSIHVPRTDETRALIGRPQLESMKVGSVLINTSRGGVVDEEAVATALIQGHLGGAALDVFATEPLTREAASRFESVPNLLLTPHIAGVTIQSERRIAEAIAEAVRRTVGHQG